MARRYRVAPMSGLRARPAALAGNGFPKTPPSAKTVAQNPRAALAILKKTSSIVLGTSSIHPACPCRGSRLSYAPHIVVGLMRALRTLESAASRIFKPRACGAAYGSPVVKPREGRTPGEEQNIIGTPPYGGVA